jgi:hypothetical protein
MRGAVGVRGCVLSILREGIRTCTLLPSFTLSKHASPPPDSSSQLQTPNSRLQTPMLQCLHAPETSASFASSEMSSCCRHLLEQKGPTSDTGNGNEQGLRYLSSRPLPCVLCWLLAYIDIPMPPYPHTFLVWPSAPSSPVVWCSSCLSRCTIREARPAANARPSAATARQRHSRICHLCNVPPLLSCTPSPSRRVSCVCICVCIHRCDVRRPVPEIAPHYTSTRPVPSMQQ